MNKIVRELDTQRLENEKKPQKTSYATFVIGDQLCGIPSLKIQDILKPNQIAPVPLSPPEVMGSINLRGRIVTVVNMRKKLGFKEHDHNLYNSGVTVEYMGDFYTLLVDEIGDVMDIDNQLFENNISKMDTNWNCLIAGVIRLESALLIILDPKKLLSFTLK